MNILGQKIEILINDKDVNKAGNHKITWEDSKVANGIYLYQLRTKEVTLTKRMIVMK